MRLFRRKPRRQLEEFCEEFFVNQVMAPRVAGVNFGSVLARSVMQTIATVSPSFASVNVEQLEEEIVLLRLEMFSLAFFHVFGTKKAQHESSFTWRFLTSRGHEDIWNNLIEYNKMIPKATSYEFDPGSGDGRFALVRLDKMRMEEFSKWVNSGFDPQSVARVVNRLGSERSWSKNITPQVLARKLSHRLNCELTEEGEIGLSASIYGFYQGAREVMSPLRIEV